MECRTKVFDNHGVKGSEFLRKVKAIAKQSKLAYHWIPERGVGSHGTVYLGERFAVVKDLNKEIGNRVTVQVPPPGGVFSVGRPPCVPLSR